MDSEEQLLWLVLEHLAGRRAATLRELQTTYPDPDAILTAPVSAWRQAGADQEMLAERAGWHRNRSRHPAQEQARLDQDQLAALGGRLVPCGDAEYPLLLGEIHDPPPLLYMQGDPACLAKPILAIVGSRKASSGGRRAATEFAHDLVNAGFAVCSGMALGIDGAAHQGALDAGGATLAVMATGLDICYPRRHRQLHEAICDRGLVLTEAPPGSQPLRERFPQRNRIISGLSLGVLVVEAALRSGSLITARLALEHNREVFALPHSIYNPQGRGCHSLISQGAKLVESVADIVQEFPVVPITPVSVRAADKRPVPDGPSGAIYKVIGYEPLSVDELVSLSGCDVPRVLGAVLELELAGLIDNSDGRYVRC
jgi:DNA processing protein